MSTRLEKPILSRNDENGPVVMKKHPRSSINRKPSVHVENPVGKSFDISKSKSTKKTQRNALGDLSNTARVPSQQKSAKAGHKLTVSSTTTSAINEEFPDIEYMPPPVIDEDPKFQTPDYFKGILTGALKTNPFKLSTQTSGNEPIEVFTASDDLPDLFYQLDFGTDSIELPNIDDLHL